jgi:hypothetical protein
MTQIVMHLEGDGCWPDLAERRDDVVHLTEDTPLEVALLQAGMQSGKASVAIRFNLPEGKIVIAESSLAVLGSAIKGFEARAGVAPGHTFLDEVRAMRAILQSGLPAADGADPRAVEALVGALVEFERSA